MVWAQAAIATTLFFFGASVGSFLNVVVYRVPAGRSVVSPGSACGRCEEPIRWFDNLPVISWFVLRGKCRNCGASYSFRYPAVEAFTGAFFVIAALRWGLSIQALTVVTVASILIAIALIDHDHWLIDDRMTIAVAVVGLVGHGASMMLDEGLELSAAATSTALHLGAGLAAFALLWIMGSVMSRALDKEALGGGDAPLFAAIVCATGPAGMLPLLMLASVQGLIGWGLMKALGDGIGDRSVEHEDGWAPEEGALPLGIFLALGGLEVMIAGPELMDAYINLVRTVL